MSRLGTLIASGLLVAFGSIVLIVQLSDFGTDHVEQGAVVRSYGRGSIIGAYVNGQHLARMPGIVDRGGGMNRRLQLVLPEDTKVFLAGMTGETNGDRGGYYYYLAYYLFPREVEVTLGPPVFTLKGIEGTTTESDAVMQANGYDTRVDIAQNGDFHVKGWHGTARELKNPDWFDSWTDVMTASLLPVLTALAGAGLVRLIFGEGLTGRMTILEQLACGLGLGMMAVAAVTLGVKLCGCQGRDVVLALTGAGGLFEVWRARANIGIHATAAGRTLVRAPVAAVLLVIGLATSLILFRLAALQGVNEFDAAADWLFKAKILFLSTGHEIGDWIANPRFVYDRPDYPTLVPSLHAATYDSLGHVDEFVTKFWPVWMLLFLVGALASLIPAGADRFQASAFFCLGMFLLPFSQCYAEMEGATLPMTFFVVLGLVQCTLALLEENGSRLGLGLTLLFGAAMTKFEGAVFLALAVAGLLLIPTARRLFLLPRCGWVVAFCALAALPFVCLRAQMHVVHYFDSGWFGYLVAEPATTFSSVPKLFSILLAHMFVDSDFARWSVVNGQLQWTGHWQGAGSLYNHFTLGLPVLCGLLTVLVWIARPQRRAIALWIFGVYFGGMAVLSVIFASFVGLSGLEHVISEWTADDVAGRYLFPLLFAWAAALVIVCFRDMPARDPAPESSIEREPLAGQS